MKYLIFIIPIVLLISGCAPFGGYYPNEFKSLSFKPECIEVFAGGIPQRIQIRNDCDNDIIINNIESNSDSYSVGLVSPNYINSWFEISNKNPICTFDDFKEERIVIEDKVRSTKNYKCRNIFLPKNSEILIDNVVGQFKINSNDFVLIEGEWE